MPGDMRISLDLDDALILPGFLFLLELVKAELAVVHDLAHGGTALGEIFTRSSSCSSAWASASCAGDDAEHGAVRCDQADLLIPDLLIELMI